MDVTERADLNEQEWLDTRRTGIGSSESPVLFGHGFANQSEYAIWASKVGVKLPAPDAATQWLFDVGHAVEPVYAAVFQDDYVGDLKFARNRYRSWARGRVRATPDGMLYERGHPIYGLCELWECKNVGLWMRHEWLDGVPSRVQIQVQHQLAATGARGAWVSASIAGGRPQHTYIARDNEFIEDVLIPTVEDWWRIYVETRTPPDIDGSKATYSAIAAQWPHDIGEVVQLSDDDAEMIRELQSLKKEMKDRESRIEAIKNELCNKLASASYGETPSGLAVSWKHQKRRGHTVKPTEFRQFRVLEALPKGVN